MRTAALLALALAAGCRAPQPERDAESGGAPPGLVAVLPAIDESGHSSFDGDEFGRILASEVVKATGLRALRPAQLRAALGPGETIATVSDAVRVARKLGAETILACAITEFDPYDPPRVGVHAQLLSARPRSMSAGELDVLLQSASWHKGPLPMTREGARHALAAFEEVFDARDPATRRLASTYAQRASVHESELYAIQPLYLQFVSNRIVARAWEIAAAHGS